ncbi:hypothetical protein ACWEQJ_01510, partial [Streptomyces cyaneofuscatus]
GDQADERGEAEALRRLGAGDHEAVRLKVTLGWRTPLVKTNPYSVTERNGTLAQSVHKTFVVP